MNLIWNSISIYFKHYKRCQLKIITPNLFFSYRFKKLFQQSIWCFVYSNSPNQSKRQPRQQLRKMLAVALEQRYVNLYIRYSVYMTACLFVMHFKRKLLCLVMQVFSMSNRFKTNVFIPFWILFYFHQMQKKQSFVSKICHLGSTTQKNNGMASLTFYIIDRLISYFNTFGVGYE